MPAGRKPRLNWTKCLGQYTTTVRGVRYKLGTDKGPAREQFEFLLRKADLGEPADHNPTFSSLADEWLDHVQDAHSRERYRLCRVRLRSFVSFIGEGTKVNQLKGDHVAAWVGSLPA